MSTPMDDSAGAPSIKWIHSRGQGAATYRVGRSGESFVADWPGVARLVCHLNGSNATLVSVPGAPADAVAKLHVVSEVLLGELRGGLAVHASAVALDSKAILLIGRSGAGKSTTAASLCVSRGWQLIADDAALLQQRDGIVEIVPSEKHHHLNADAARALGMALTASDPNLKSVVPAKSCGMVPCPIALVACLEFDDACPDIECSSLSAAGAAGWLLSSLFRFNPTDAGARRRELDLLARLSEQAPMIRLRRPSSKPDVQPQILDRLAREHP